MKVFIGSDHNGFLLKHKLVERLKKAGYNVEDEGDERLDPLDDFPVFAKKVVVSMLSDVEDSRGILICGSGQGMAIAANRHKGIRAVVCWDREQARLARHDDDANVLALPAYLLKDHVQEAMVIIETFLNTSFDNAPRYRRRIKELDEL
jgi:ribose 5-phosphate isomerase B